MHFYEGIMHLYAGNAARAIDLFDAARAADATSLWSDPGHAYRLAATGETHRLAEMTRTLATRDVADGERHYCPVHVHALVGEPEEAVARLRAAPASAFFRYPFISADPLTASLRGRPDFEAAFAEVRDRYDAFRSSWSGARSEPSPRR